MSCQNETITLQQNTLAFTDCILLFCATISSYKNEIEYRFIKWTNFLCMNVCHSKEKNFKAWIYYIIPFDCLSINTLCEILTQLDLQRDCQWDVFKAKTCREKLFKWRNDFFKKCTEMSQEKHSMKWEKNLCRVRWYHCNVSQLEDCTSSYYNLFAANTMKKSHFKQLHRKYTYGIILIQKKDDLSRDNFFLMVRAKRWKI